MERDERRAHWDAVHANKPHDGVSWYAPGRHASLEEIEALHLPREAPILDVGCGVDGVAGPLLERGHTSVAALDISQVAVDKACEALGPRCPEVEWFAEDLLAWRPPHDFALWHDRAVFHFLLQPEERARYFTIAALALRPGGALVLSTFAPEGPERCSDLPVQRWDEAALERELPTAFSLRRTRAEAHVTPSGKTQHFRVFVLERRAA